MKFSDLVKWCLLVLFALAVTPWSAFAEEKETSKDAVAVVNGVNISRVEYDRAVREIERKASRPGRNPKAPAPTGIRRQALDKLVEMELFYQAAVKAGITVSDDEINKQFEDLRKRFPSQTEFDKWLKNNDLSEDMVKTLMRRGNTIRLFTQKELIKQIKVSDEETRAYYDGHKPAFRQPEEIRASHILIKVDPKADDAQKAEARRKIEDIQKRVQKGEDFATLAKELSEGPSKDKGGDLGYFRKGQMVKPFEEAAFSLKKDEVSGIVETQFGYHLIKVFDIKPERELSYEEVKSKIELMLKQQKLKQEVDAYYAKLKKEAKIEILLTPEELKDDYEK